MHIHNPKMEITSKKGNFPYMELVLKTNPYWVNKVVQVTQFPFIEYKPCRGLANLKKEGNFRGTTMWQPL